MNMAELALLARGRKRRIGVLAGDQGTVGTEAVVERRGDNEDLDDGDAYAYDA
jgi:hypothetical protein